MRLQKALHRIEPLQDRRRSRFAGRRPDDVGGQGAQVGGRRLRQGQQAVQVFAGNLTSLAGRRRDARSPGAVARTFVGSHRHGGGLRAEPVPRPFPGNGVLAPQGVRPADAGLFGLAQRGVEVGQRRPERLSFRRVQPALQRREPLFQLTQLLLQHARLDLLDGERLLRRFPLIATRFVHILDHRAGRHLRAVAAVLFLAAFRVRRGRRLLRLGRRVLVADKRLEIELRRLHPRLQRRLLMVEDVVDPVDQRPEGVVRQRLRPEVAAVERGQPDDLRRVVGQQLTHHVAPQRRVQQPAGRHEQVRQFQVGFVRFRLQHQFRRRQPGVADAQHDDRPAVLLADGEGQPMQHLVVGVLHEAVQLGHGVVEQHPQFRPVGRAARRQLQRRPHPGLEFSLVPARRGVGQGELHHLVDVAERPLLDLRPGAPRRRQEQLAGRRLEMVGQRVRPADFDPDARRPFAVGAGGVHAVAVDGAQQRIVRRPDDAQQAAALAGVGLALQPAEALAVVAEAKDLDDQPTENVLTGRFKQDRRLFQAVDGIGIGPQRQDLRPAAHRGGDGGAVGLAELDAEAAEVVLHGARQRERGFDPDLILVVHARDGGGLADGRRNGAACQGETKGIEIGKLQDHQRSHAKTQRAAEKASHFQAVYVPAHSVLNQWDVEVDQQAQALFHAGTDLESRIDDQGSRYIFGRRPRPPRLFAPSREILARIGSDRQR